MKADTADTILIPFYWCRGKQNIAKYWNRQRCACFIFDDSGAWWHVIDLSGSVRVFTRVLKDLERKWCIPCDLANERCTLRVESLTDSSPCWTCWSWSFKVLCVCVSHTVYVLLFWSRWRRRRVSASVVECPTLRMCSQMPYLIFLPYFWPG